MASDRGFVEHVCEQARDIADLSFRKMFGEYALYVGGKVVALVCDDQVFLKPTAAGRALLSSATEAPPYPGAKPYLLIDEYVDDRERLTELLRVTSTELAR